MNRLERVGAQTHADALGRVHLPKAVRLRTGLTPGDRVEIYLEAGSVVVAHFTPSCVFCGGTRRITSFRERPVCGRCRGKLAALARVPLTATRDKAAGAS